MLPAIVRGLAFTCALALPTLAQSVHVDPVAGVDAPGRGAPSRPYRSLTFAVAQHGSGGLADFVLAPGRYGDASGEVWPLDLPLRCAIRGAAAVGSGEVVLVADAGATALLRHAHRGAGFLAVDAIDAVGAGGAWLEVLADGPLAYASVTLRHVNSSLPDGCRFRAANGGSGSLTITDSSLRGVRNALCMMAPFPAMLQLQVDRSELIGGIHTLELDATGGGLVTAVLRGTEIRGGALLGVRAATDRAGDIGLTLEHVLLARCGLGAAPPVRGAALGVETGANGRPPTVSVVNSLFAHNAHDAPVAGAGCAFGRNLVQQPDLAGIGGNVLGTAHFVDAGRDDYRLAPDSPGIDAGDPHAVTLWTDRDGEPRIAARPDLGPDEVHRHALHAIGATAIGSRWEFALTGDPGVPFGVVVGTARRPGSFGVGRVHLDGVLVATTLTGTTGADGVGRFAIDAPSDPRLIGLELYWQAFAGAVPEIGANAWRTVARP